MATGKNSFVLYTSYVHSIDLLTNEQAGKLFKHILNYVNDFDPKEEDVLVRVAFEPIKQQLKRDLKEWRLERKKRSAAGKKGMKSRWEKQITNDNSVIKPITAITVDVNEDVFVNVNDNVDVKRERGFSPPTKEDVILAMVEKLDDFTAMGEADKFINFYESNNWKVGKNKMKNWKAAAAGWISRMKNFNNGTTKKGTSGERLDALNEF